MKVFLGSDHAGYKMKEMLEVFVHDMGHEAIDKGVIHPEPQDDYPDYIAPVAREVSRNPDNTRGIILGGSGQGEAMLANRFKGIRAVVFYGGSMEIVKLSRTHNNANILSLGARFISDKEAREAVALWLDTPFSEDKRHNRRIGKIKRITNKLLGRK